jgi:hypothetical protein
VPANGRDAIMRNEKRHGFVDGEQAVSLVRLHVFTGAAQLSAASSDRVEASESATIQAGSGFTRPRPRSQIAPDTSPPAAGKWPMREQCCATSGVVFHPSAVNCIIVQPDSKACILEIPVLP